MIITKQNGKNSIWIGSTFLFLFFFFFLFIFLQSEHELLLSWTQFKKKNETVKFRVLFTILHRLSWGNINTTWAQETRTNILTGVQSSGHIFDDNYKTKWQKFILNRIYAPFSLFFFFFFSFFTFWTRAIIQLAKKKKWNPWNFES